MKIIKTLSVAVVIVAVVLTTCIGSFALPINVKMTDNYFYNESASPVAAPIAYRPVTVKGSETFGGSFDPRDLCVRDDYLYITDKSQSEIIAVNSDYSEAFRITTLTDSEDYEVPDLDIYTYNDDGTREADSSLKNRSKYNLNNPEGCYVDSDGMIYIADTQNRRVVVCDKEGAVYNVVQSVRISSLGTSFVFKPKKIVVDSAGTISVLCDGCNKGVVQVDANGSFLQFYAQPKVTLAVTDWIYALVGASSSKKAKINSVAAEYVSISIDDSGFIYTAATDTETVEAVRKLAADGSDVLNQEDAKFKSFGDVVTTSKIVDVATSSESKTYTLLDSYMGRFFTYTDDGMQLFVGGGSGSQFGRFISPVAIACFGSNIVVADNSNRILTIYEMTEYANNIINAIASFKSGDSEAAEKDWNQVLTYNSNMYIAYDTLGDIYKLRGADTEDDDPNREVYYNTALHYYELSGNMTEYAVCYKEIRNIAATKNFGIIFGSIIVIFVGTVSAILIHGKKKKRNEEKRRAGL